jgi:uroporphyrinogen decarboxylase
MNQRQRFAATMHYQPRDRCCLYDFNYWDETIPAWHEQGLAVAFTRRNVGDYFGLDASLGGGVPGDWSTGLRSGLYPAFETEVLEDKGKTLVVRDGNGVIVEQGKDASMSIPMHLGHTLVDRQSWTEHYKPRLDPDTPGRLPDDWLRRVAIWTDDQRDHPVWVGGGSLFGWLRDWMGIENLSLVVYDDPAWFEEMVTTVADLQIAMLQRIFATGGRFDGCQMWEDMCYNAGPLLGVEHFKQYLVPHYRRISELCRSHGVDVIWLDCDGNIEHLMPLWLDAGINCMFPVEIGTWGADPVAYRRQYGKDLLMMGGFDKHILAQDQKAIHDEIHRLAPLVEEGGFIPFCDHRVPPDVPLANYLAYLVEARRVWGGSHESLRPMPAEQLLATARQ